MHNVEPFRWAVRTLFAGDKNSDGYKAAQFIFNNSDMTTMENMTWDDDVHHLMEVYCVSTGDVVTMLAPDINDGYTGGEYTRMVYVSYKGVLSSQPAKDLVPLGSKSHVMTSHQFTGGHPTTLASRQDYEDVPEGSVIIDTNENVYIKEGDVYLHTNGAVQSTYSDHHFYGRNIVCRVLHWSENR